MIRPAPAGGVEEGKGQPLSAITLGDYKSPGRQAVGRTVRRLLVRVVVPLGTLDYGCRAALYLSPWRCLVTASSLRGCIVA